MNRHSIRFRIAVIVSLAIAISLGGFAVFLTTEIGSVNERDETAKLKSSNDMLMSMIAQTDSILREQAESWSHVFAAEMAGSFSLEGGETPILKLNGVPLNGTTRQVDNFNQLGKGNVATIFVRQGDDFLRIATSLKKEDGNRAVGTQLGSGHPAYASVRAGQPFIGKATLFGHHYMTKYTPVTDAKNEVVGLLFVGINIDGAMNEVKKTIKSIKFGQTGYTYVLDSKPGATAGNLLVHPSLEGKNLIDATDSDGKFFIKEILEKRTGVIVYPWLDKSSDNPRSREKIVIFDEYKSWN